MSGPSSGHESHVGALLAGKWDSFPTIFKHLQEKVSRVLCAYMCLYYKECKKMVFKNPDA